MTKARDGTAGVRLVVLWIAGAALLAGCGVGAPSAQPTAAPIPAPYPTPSVAVATSLVQVNASLRPSGLGAVATTATVRPGEPPSFAGVPRWPFAVALPGDPDGTAFVVYEFPDADVALAAGRDLADFLASGPGRVEYPPDAAFALRQVGPTLIFYAWSAQNAPDRVGATAVERAIDSVGTEIPVRRS